MITIERKKLEQALHELEGIPVYKKYGVRISNAITALNEALSQTAQEPVAQWQKRHHLWTEGAWENAEEHDAKQWRDKAQGWEIRALYTTPQQRPWVGLTDEERNKCVNTPFVTNQWANIETKLKEKNT